MPSDRASSSPASWDVQVKRTQETIRVIYEHVKERPYAIASIKNALNLIDRLEDRLEYLESRRKSARTRF